MMLERKPSSSWPKGENASLSFSSVVNLESPERDENVKQKNRTDVDMKVILEHSASLQSTNEGFVWLSLNFYKR